MNLRDVRLDLFHPWAPRRMEQASPASLIDMSINSQVQVEVCGKIRNELSRPLRKIVSPLAMTVGLVLRN